MTQTIRALYSGDPGVPPLLATKIAAPPLQAALSPRPRLIAQLDQALQHRLTLVAAPAGFGKTTLLAEWAHANGRAFAWVSLDERDNDPKVLLSYVAAALDGVEPIDGEVFEALGSPDELHPAQEALLQTRGLQCGFCTPGFVVLSAWLRERRPDADPAEVREVLSSNLCRCTGYGPIVEAASRR